MAKTHKTNWKERISSIENELLKLEEKLVENPNHYDELIDRIDELKEELEKAIEKRLHEDN